MARAVSGRAMMAALAEFSPDDRRTVENRLAIYSRGSGQILTIELLVARWYAFVDKLKRGAVCSARDYEADLQVRGTLEELGECLADDGRHRLLMALLEPDRRFLSLTMVIDSRARRTWWMRYPRSLAGGQGGARVQAAYLRSRLAKRSLREPLDP